MSRRFSLTAWFAALMMLALSMSHTPARPEPVRKAPPPAPASQVGAPVADVELIAPPDEVETVNCFDTWTPSCVRVLRSGRINPHVIAVPQPGTPEERAAADARDRRWAARCQPVIRQDRYGMPRYSYAAPGCEYGRLD